MTQLRRGSTVNLVRFCSSPLDAVAATVEIVSSAGEVLLASTAATRDTTAATISAGLSGSRSVTVNTIVGFVVGSTYVVSSNDGLSVALRLVAKAATTGSLSFDSEIPFSSSSGAVTSQILSKATVALPDLTYRDARIIWGYTSGGATIEEVQTIDIVRQPFTLDVSEQRVSEAEASFVDVSTRRPGRHVDQAKLDVENWLRSQQIKPDLVRDRSMLEQACVWRACMLRYLGTEVRETCRAEYEQALAQFKTSGSWVEETEDAETKSTSSSLRPKYILVG
jgi:hypothetical protein